MVNVLFAAVLGGFALGQAATNLQYFTQASVAIFEGPASSNSVLLLHASHAVR